MKYAVSWYLVCTKYGNNCNILSSDVLKQIIYLTFISIVKTNKLREPVIYEVVL